MSLPDTIQWYELIWVLATMLGVVGNGLVLTLTLGDGLAVHTMRDDDRYLTDEDYRDDYRMRRLAVEMDARNGIAILWLQVILFLVSVSSLGTPAADQVTDAVVLTRVLRTIAYVSIPAIFMTVGFINLHARRRMVAIYDRAHLRRLRGGVWDGRERRQPPMSGEGEH